MKVTDLLQDVRSRNGGGRWGIGIASAYLHQLESSGDPAKAFDITPEAWDAALKEADQKLTYCGDETQIDEIVVGILTDEERDKLRKGCDLADIKASKLSVDDVPGAVMVFDTTVTTFDEDRDGDILDPRGASVDPLGPMLLNHFTGNIIGRPIKILAQNKKHLREREAIIDSPIGRDAAKLIEFGALRRMSHGFIPTNYEPRKDSERGWHIMEYEMLERSVVAVASNRGAVIEAWDALGEKMFATNAMKQWAKSVYSGRQTTVRGWTPPPQKKQHIIRFGEAIFGGDFVGIAEEDTEDGSLKIVSADADLVDRLRVPTEKQITAGDVNAFLASASDEDVSQAQRVIEARANFNAAAPLEELLAGFV